MSIVEIPRFISLSSHQPPHHPQNILPLHIGCDIDVIGEEDAVVLGVREVAAVPFAAGIDRRDIENTVWKSYKNFCCNDGASCS